MNCAEGYNTRIEVIFCVHLSTAGINSCTVTVVIGECCAVHKTFLNFFIIVYYLLT